MSSSSKLDKTKRLTPYANKNAAFIDACMSGSLEVAKWLEEMGIYTRIDDGEAFVRA